MIVSAAIADAAPRFVAPGSPDAVKLANAAWKAGEACVGTPGLAWRTVRIHVEPMGGRPSYARVEPVVGLTDIYVDPIRPASTLVHEVAHAWVHAGPPTLVEGATQLLTDCMLPRLGLPPSGSAVRGLRPLSDDLRGWRNEQDARVVPREYAYAAAHSLFVSLTTVVPARSLWRQSWSWEEFDEVLGAAGTTGAYIREALAGGLDAQRRAFGDEDGDGLTGVAEHIAGTDQDKPDTDGAGWWDGAPPDVVARGVRLPADGTPVCVGRTLGGALTLRAGEGPNPLAFPLVPWLEGRPLREVDDRGLAGPPASRWDSRRCLAGKETCGRWSGALSARPIRAAGRTRIGRCSPANTAHDSWRCSRARSSRWARGPSPRSVSRRYAGS